MGIAMSVFHGAAARLKPLMQGMARWCAARLGAGSASRSCQRQVPAFTSQPAHHALVATRRAPALPSRPLRVLRVEGQGPLTGGRMVISGRLADVCAELDRLAALEAQLSGAVDQALAPAR